MRRAALLAGFVLAAGALAEAWAQPPCKPGTRLIRESETAYYCLQLDLPKVDPRFFVSENEVKFLRAQLVALGLKKRSYQGQLAALDRMRDGLSLAARDLETIRREVVFDNMSHALTVISSGVSAGVADGPVKTALQQQLNILKAEVNALAAAQAEPFSDRQMQKAIDAAFNLKNLVQDNAGRLPPGHLDALKKATDTLPKMLRISERFAKPNPDASTVRLTADTLDDLAAIASIFLPTLQATRATVHIVGGEVAMWHLARSKSQIDAAFVQSQTAKRYYQARIGEVEELEAFYRERVIRAGKQ